MNMNMYHVATISSQRQITLPKSMLDMLGLGKKSKVIVQPKKDTLVIKKKQKSITQKLAGSLAHLVSEQKKNTPIQQAIETSKDMMAQEAAYE